MYQLSFIFIIGINTACALQYDAFYEYSNCTGQIVRYDLVSVLTQSCNDGILGLQGDLPDNIQYLVDERYNDYHCKGSKIAETYYPTGIRNPYTLWQVGCNDREFYSDHTFMGNSSSLLGCTCSCNCILGQNHTSNYKWCKEATIVSTYVSNNTNTSTGVLNTSCVNRTVYVNNTEYVNTTVYVNSTSPGFTCENITLINNCTLLLNTSNIGLNISSLCNNTSETTTVDHNCTIDECMNYIFPTNSSGPVEQSKVISIGVKTKLTLIVLLQLGILCVLL